MKLTPTVRDWSIRDPSLSELGFGQCKELGAKLEKTLPGRLDVDAVFVSPMLRTLQTATDALKWLDKSVPIYAHAGWQETTDNPCDVGTTIPEIAPGFPHVDFSHVDPVFPEKKSEQGKAYAFNRRALVTRAQGVLAELHARPEKVVLVVSHSAFLSKAVSGAMFGNADYRIFSFAEQGEKVPEYDGLDEDEKEKEIYPDLPPLLYRLKEWDETKSEGGMGWSYRERRQIGEGLPA